jgi:hypothetical protein
MTTDKDWLYVAMENLHSEGCPVFLVNRDCVCPVKDAHAAIQAHIAEIIGEDEFTDTVSTIYRPVEIRNDLRAEQRKRAGL